MQEQLPGMREGKWNPGREPQKHSISTDVALRDIVNKRFEAGIGLAQKSAYRCGGSVGLAALRQRTNFPFHLALAFTSVCE